MDDKQIRNVLETLGKSVPPGSKLTLLGGSGLALLGNPRQTIDIDFVGDDINPSKLHSQIMEEAKKMNVFAEPVPIDRFIPLPPESQNRNIFIDTFNHLDIFVADPYCIAISKVERGFDTDFDDLVFLIKENLININQLALFIDQTLTRSKEFDIDPIETRSHLDELFNRLDST